jgi:hypothetical protein
MPTTPSSGGSQIFGRWTKRIDGPPVGLGFAEFSVSMKSRRVFVGTDGDPIVLTEASPPNADSELYLPAVIPNFLESYQRIKNS